jgi:hypothetical protein
VPPGGARISTNEQTLPLQQMALKQASCDRDFSDAANGARPFFDSKDGDHTMEPARSVGADRLPESGRSWHGVL